VEQILRRRRKRLNPTHEYLNVLSAQAENSRVSVLECATSNNLVLVII
jgi:hypothetical protein